MSLVDEAHQLSSLYGLVNVPSAVWIDEAGFVRRIDEGSYATTHNLGGFEFGRSDYAPMVANWVKQGDASEFVQPVGTLALARPSNEQALADPTFKLGVYFHRLGNEAKANQYWEAAQALNPASWNYARQDWSFTPELANDNWTRKFQTLEGQPYYKPIDGLDKSK
ncbi:MAG: hypothetical protein HC809_13460 [Gammaproteobacteria bacterium]|nr:hypothetical protein [Gammaproteobacteria bacterium]